MTGTVLGSDSAHSIAAARLNRMFLGNKKKEQIASMRTIQR